jgi:hypothetical protein
MVQHDSKKEKEKVKKKTTAASSGTLISLTTKIIPWQLLDNSSSWRGERGAEERELEEREN